MATQVRKPLTVLDACLSPVVQHACALTWELETNNNVVEESRKIERHDIVTLQNTQNTSLQRVLIALIALICYWKDSLTN